MGPAMARLFGIRVPFVGTGASTPRRNFDGIALRSDPKTIYFSANSTKPFHFVIGHEFLHHLRRTAPGL